MIIFKVINAYLSLLQREQNVGDTDHIFVMPSYTAVLWSKGKFDHWLYSDVKFAMYKWVFLPANVGNHWVLLAANMTTKTVSVLDSMGGTNQTLINNWKKYMAIGSQKTVELANAIWISCQLVSSIQRDGNACGAFVLLNAFVLTKNLQLEEVNHALALEMREFVRFKLLASSMEPPSQRTRCDMVGCTSPKRATWVMCNVCEMENILFWTCLLLLVYRTDVCKADTAHKPKEVLVIGGGISGLAAARKLVNHPSQMFDVTVLEARKERYGGRVWTNRKLFKKPLGAETDLGAVWINSKVKDNPILAITRKGELETKVSGPIQLHVPEADKIFKGDEANKIFTEVFSIMQSAVDKVKATGVDIPLQKAVEDEISGHSFQGDRAIITSILRNHNAVSKPDYSTVHFDPVKQFGWNTIVVDGYDQVLDAIVSGLGSELPLSISLNQIVRQIKIDSKKKKVIVRTKDLNQVSADLVIVAVPVGVLRSEAVLFEPVLPKEWYKAVKELGVYDSQKVIVGFSEAFWPSDAGVFTMTTPEGEEPFIQTWFNMQNLIDRPFLVGSLYDGAAINLEQTPIEELKELVIKTLGKLFGGEDLVRQYNLTTIMRSQWTGDPFSMGSGAYPRTGKSHGEIPVDW
ncbi:uncharacterized protein [Argopecten irradians]|uniref:uncharacterized protein isoform X3 n=1 Tax=Argopecten irradians TaxID=31199 RepID=UPI0037155F0E